MLVAVFECTKKVKRPCPAFPKKVKKSMSQISILYVISIECVIQVRKMTDVSEHLQSYIFQTKTMESKENLAHDKVAAGSNMRLLAGPTPDNPV